MHPIRYPHPVARERPSSSSSTFPLPLSAPLVSFQIHWEDSGFRRNSLRTAGTRVRDRVRAADPFSLPCNKHPKRVCRNSALPLFHSLSLSACKCFSSSEFSSAHFSLQTPWREEEAWIFLPRIHSVEGWNVNTRLSAKERTRP